MLTTIATPAMVAAWRQTWLKHKGSLSPNRKKAAEIEAYLKAKYPLTTLTDPVALAVVTENVLSNECFAEKLSQGQKPQPVAFTVQNNGSARALYRGQDDIFKGLTIMVGLDMATGYFVVEGSSHLWDELFYFRGLDSQDIENSFLVAQYIECREKFEGAKNDL